MEIPSFIRNCFPADSRIVTVSSDTALVLAISWKVGTDPKRPFKRSKTIRLEINEAAVVDYEATSVAVQRKIAERLERLIRAQLQTFDPDHQAGEHQAPPVVHWIVSTVVTDRSLSG